MNRRSFLKMFGMGAVGAAVVVLPVPVPAPRLATVQPTSPLVPAPAFTFSADADTGMYRTGDNTIGFAT